MAKNRRVLVLANSEAEPGLAHALGQNGGATVRRADSKEAFSAELREFEPDFVLIDDSLEGVETGHAIALVRAERPMVPAIIVMRELDEVHASEYLRAGAEAFVLKQNLFKLDAVVASALSAREPLDKLTARQLDVLRRIAEGQKTREIADDLDLSVKTVETHRSEIKKRLEIHELAGLVRYAARVGLVSVAVPAHQNGSDVSLTN
jgi:DNA-binding NarL/FixJ family response regulator